MTGNVTDNCPDHPTQADGVRTKRGVAEESRVTGLGFALKAPRQGAFILSAAVRREPPPTPAD